MTNVRIEHNPFFLKNNYTLYIVMARIRSLTICLNVVIFIALFRFYHCHLCRYRMLLGIRGKRISNNLHIAFHQTLM
jgi:hypothetical protein